MLEECGLINVLRRTGTPLKVVVDSPARELVEGTDFEIVRDERLGVPQPKW